MVMKQPASFFGPFFPSALVCGLGYLFQWHSPLKLFSLIVKYSYLYLIMVKNDLHSLHLKQVKFIESGTSTASASDQRPTCFWIVASLLQFLPPNASHLGATERASDNKNFYSLITWWRWLSRCQVRSNFVCLAFKISLTKHVRKSSVADLADLAWQCQAFPPFATKTQSYMEGPIQACQRLIQFSIHFL